MPVSVCIDMCSKVFAFLIDVNCIQVPSLCLPISPKCLFLIREDLMNEFKAVPSWKHFNCIYKDLFLVRLFSCALVYEKKIRGGTPFNT